MPQCPLVHLGAHSWVLQVLQKQLTSNCARSKQNSLEEAKGDERLPEAHGKPLFQAQLSTMPCGHNCTTAGAYTVVVEMVIPTMSVKHSGCSASCPL